MTPVAFLPAAREELLESACYYQTQSPGLGRRFSSAVREAILRIQEHPQLYPVVEDDIRRCRVQRFPYGIVYRPTADRIVVIAVVHLHRQPGYWKSRAGPA
jgi:plasmid stabilization system protein ParE